MLSFVVTAVLLALVHAAPTGLSGGPADTILSKLTPEQRKEVVAITENQDIPMKDVEANMQTWLEKQPKDVQESAKLLKAHVDQKIETAKNMVRDQSSSLSAPARSAIDDILTAFDHKQQSMNQLRDTLESKFSALSDADKQSLQNMRKNFDEGEGEEAVVNPADVLQNMGVSEEDANKFFDILSNDDETLAEKERQMQEWTDSLPEDVQDQARQFENDLNAKRQELHDAVDKKIESLSGSAKSAAEELVKMFTDKDKTIREIRQGVEEKMDSLSDEDRDALESLQEEISNMFIP